MFVFWVLDANMETAWEIEIEKKSKKWTRIQHHWEKHLTQKILCLTLLK